MDSPGERRWDTRAVCVGWMLFVILACAHFTLRYVWRNAPFLNLPLYAQGGESLPFQGRVLMAWILHVSAANQHLSGLFSVTAKILPSGIGDPYHQVLLVVDYMAIVIAVMAGRAILQFLTNDRAFSAWAALLVLYMSYFNLIVGYRMYMLPYDIVALAVFMVAVWLVVTERYWLLLPVVILGILNRETAVFIPVFLALYRWFGRKEPTRMAGGNELTPRPVLYHLVLQVALCLAIRIWIGHLFLNNPHGPPGSNGAFGIHLRQNLSSLVKPPQWPLLFSLFGFSLPLFFADFKRIGNRAMAYSTGVMLVLWFIAMMLVGVIVEIRVFSELTAFVMPCVALIVWERWRRPMVLLQSQSTAV